MIKQSTLKMSAVIAGGLTWSLICALLGLGLLRYAQLERGHLPRAAEAGAVVLVTGGLFVFLVFVADQLFPQAPRRLTLMVKLAVNLLAWGALLLVLDRLWLAAL